MSTEAIWQISTSSVEDTLKLGALIGAKLRGGEVLELVSDVGGGKTTFVRGLASGAGSQDHVSSPSFTISNLYKSEALQLVHFDFYRLNDPGLIAIELKDILDDKTNVVIVEWAGMVDGALPQDRIRINIMVTGEESRHFRFSYPESYHELMAGLSDD